MLKSLDVLIGLIVVLLALSMAVTLITQGITAAINSRGRHLLRGLTDLLQQLDPALTSAVSDAIAAHVLTHPLVSGSKIFVGDGAAGVPRSVIGRLWWFFTGRRYGNIVHREEFTKLLLAFAAGDGTHKLEAAAQAALLQALKANGIADPVATLKGLRNVALDLERSNPELSHAARQNIALLQEAKSDFVAKINAWYDQTMDRTSQRFTASTRAITFVSACLVAVGLQIDTPLLVNRLAGDDVLREALVQQALAIEKDRNAQPTGPQLNEYRPFLEANGIITLPSMTQWWPTLKQANPLGITITALLLSLGAPFWYSALSRLLQLRSVLAVRDDAERLSRQLNDVPAQSRPAATGDAPAVG